VGFKGLFAATASVALMATPTLASAQQAAAPRAATEVAPANERVTDGSELRGGFIIPLIAVIAIILGILAATHHNHDLPHSP
jgi:glycerol uptake facilitator-like aquaporin